MASCSAGSATTASCAEDEGRASATPSRVGEPGVEEVEAATLRGWRGGLTHDVPPHGGRVHALYHVVAHLPSSLITCDAARASLEVVGRPSAVRGMRTRWPRHGCVIHRGWPGGSALHGKAPAPPLPALPRRRCMRAAYSTRAWTEISPLNSHPSCAFDSRLPGMLLRARGRVGRTPGGRWRWRGCFWCRSRRTSSTSTCDALRAPRPALATTTAPCGRACASGRAQTS